MLFDKKCYTFFQQVNNFYFIVQGDVNSAWKHDMFDGVKKVGRGAIGNAGTTKLLVSNLDFGVSDSDIQVLKYYMENKFCAQHVCVCV